MVDESVAAEALRHGRAGKLGIVVGIILGTLIAAGCGAGAGTAKPDGTHATGPAAEVASLLGGIPQDGDSLGDPNAPLTLAYFGDLQCPFCRQFTLAALPAIIKRWVRSGQLRIEYRALKTATRNRAVFESQQVAALAAGRQNRMWDYLELFYHEQQRENTGYVTESYLQGLAQQVSGLDLIAWTVARNDSELNRALVVDRRLANAAALTGTPAFLLGKTGGTVKRLEPGTLTESTPYDAAIEKLLKG